MVLAALTLSFTHQSIALPRLANSEATKAGKVKCSYVTAPSLRKFAKETWQLIRWEREPKQRTIKAWQAKLQCAAGPGHRKAGKRAWRKLKLAFHEHRKHKLIQRARLRYLPYECGGGMRSAIDCATMLCESEGSYTARNLSSTAGGKYQILDTTWHYYGGRDYPGSHDAASAPPIEQDRIAGEIYADSGGGAWVC